MNRECQIHKNNFIFLCCEISCYKFLCLKCVNDHQKLCHQPNNSYQDLKLIEEIPGILKERVEKIQENLSHFLIQKKDLILQYFIERISEISSYYFENLRLSLFQEPLDIIRISDDEFLDEIKRKIDMFNGNEEKSPEDYVAMLKETEITTNIEKIKKKEIHILKNRYPDTRKDFEKAEELISEIEHCFLEFKKRVFSESYAFEINQMLNFIDPEEKKAPLDLEKASSAPLENPIHEVLKIFKETQSFEEVKALEEQKTFESTQAPFIKNPLSLEETKKDVKNIENQQKFLEELKITEINESPEDFLSKDAGIFLDYELESFEFEIESLNLENSFLFLYHEPETSSEYFKDVLDLVCKRLFGDDLCFVKSVEEILLNEQKFMVLSTCGDLKLKESKSNEFEAYRVSIELVENCNVDLLFRRNGLQLILPFDEDKSLKTTEVRLSTEKEFTYHKEFMKKFKEKYCAHLKEKFKSRPPQNFTSPKFMIQFNQDFDKLRIIDRALGFRTFLRNFDECLSLQDFNKDHVFEYFASNCQQLVQINELDIFVNISQFTNFIIFNNKFDDLMICNLMTPELISYYFDLVLDKFNNDEIPLEVVIKTNLLNSNVKVRSFFDGTIFADHLEILSENGEIETIRGIQGLGIYCCNITIKMQEAFKTKTVYLLKHRKRFVLAFDENAMIASEKEKEPKPIKLYDEDLTAILRISQYFIKYNFLNATKSILKFENYFLVYILSDNSSFYVRRLYDEENRLLLFYQKFELEKKKYESLTDKCIDALKIPSDTIYKETEHLQFVFQISSNDLFVRWNGSTMNCFNLENRKFEITKAKKQVYRKKEKEKRPEKIKRETEEDEEIH